MQFVYYCIYLYLLLKPFYIFQSGSIQPSDIFLLLGFFAILLVTHKNKSILIKKITDNKYFFFFLLMSFSINTIYYILLGNFKFILSSLYILFNFWGIIVFSVCFENEKFIVNISKILRIDLFIQLFVYFTNFGRYYGAYRYMGTFNDPNQFGYFVLISLTFIYLINDKVKSNHKEIIITFLAIFLILQSASTGMLMGLLILLGVRLYRYSESKKFFKYISAFLIIAALFGYIVTGNQLKEFLNNNDNFLISRINDKFNRVKTSSNGPTLIQERGYDKIIKNPKYILYGSGEGVYERFNGYTDIEIHATFPSLLFYYGLFPFIMLVKWIYYKLKYNKLISISLVIPLFVESFTLLNQRQVLFWVIILFYEFIRNEGTKKYDN